MDFAARAHPFKNRPEMRVCTFVSARHVRRRWARVTCESKEDGRFMNERQLGRWVMRGLMALLALGAATGAAAQNNPQGPKEWLCDASYRDCRAPLPVYGLMFRE